MYRVPLRTLSGGLDALLLAPACKPEPVEGDEGGECSDGADNDQDGYFDCDDNGCWGSTDCEEGTDSESEGDSDTDSDADSDSDSDADSDSDSDTDPENPAGKYAPFTLDYTLTWDFTCNSPGVWDCVQTFQGSGTREAVTAEIVTFRGPWALKSSDCAASLDATIWTDPSGTAYTSFGFDPEGATLTDWYVHSAANGASEADAEWYITEQSAKIAWNKASFEVEEYVPDAFLNLTHSVSVQFEE